MTTDQILPPQRAESFICLFVCALVLIVPARAISDAATASGNFDGPAELPRVVVHSAMSDTPAPGKVIRVRAGEDAGAAVEKASCGDTVQLQAGATFGRITLPAKKCDDAHWIIIRTSDPDSKLPPEGTRLEAIFQIFQHRGQ